MPPPKTPPGATAAEFAENRFGGPTQFLETIVTVGVALVRLVPPNPRRVAWLAQNRGLTNVGFGFNREVAAATGFLLGAEGGVATANVETDGEGVTWEVFAISTVAGQSVRVLETIRV